MRVPSDTIATTPTRANQDRRWVVTATAFQAPRYPTAIGVWGALREYTDRNYALRSKGCATQGRYKVSGSHLVSSGYVLLAGYLPRRDVGSGLPGQRPDSGTFDAPGCG
ncbi:hypothetical protein Cci01nite_79780 [Catellatospora citrea]|uniref:Uncharacterized protein n=1 Tax=Catellatospora citrea TaxID=53366 RepID=A0A8J3KL06_9ACTN|nr:hypothetical protein Cci01nite_79780 [Catellatospora citrea]